MRKNICPNVLPEDGTFRVICHTCTFPAKNYPLHWHENAEICRVLKGNCVFRVGDADYPAGPGDLLAVGKNVLHQFVLPKGENSGDALTVRILQFASPLLFDGTETLRTPRLFISREKIEGYPGLSEKIDALLNLLEAETVLGQNEVSPYVRHLISAFYALLAESFPADDGTSSPDTDKKDFHLALLYIKEHFKEDLKVETIAKEFGIPRGRLAECFERFSGMRLSEFIRVERIHYVNYLLNEGYPISAAAMESGFQNLRTFNITYRRLVGCTPSEYIKKAKKQKNAPKADGETR